LSSTQEVNLQTSVLKQTVVLQPCLKAPSPNTRRQSGEQYRGFRGKERVCKAFPR